MVRVGQFRGSGNQQEHAGRHLLDQRNLLFLGHGDALVRSKGAADKKDYSGERGASGHDLWLLGLSRSATSGVCLAIGCAVILAVHSEWGKRHPTFLKVLIPTTFCLYLILAFGFGLSGEFARQVGRNPTLSDRTLIWSTVLSLHTNPIVGTGYESFWLGPRLLRIWPVVGQINEAHNGYLDIYLNLGVIGVSFSPDS